MYGLDQLEPLRSVTKLALSIQQPEGEHDPSIHNWFLSHFPKAESLILQLDDPRSTVGLAQTLRLRCLYLIEGQAGVLERMTLNAYLPRVQRLKLETISSSIGPFLRTLPSTVPNVQSVWIQASLCGQLQGAEAVRNFMPRCTYFELQVDDLWSRFNQTTMLELVRVINDRALARSNTSFVIKMIIEDQENCPLLDLFYERIQRIGRAGLADNLRIHC